MTSSRMHAKVQMCQRIDFVCKRDPCECQYILLGGWHSSFNRVRLVCILWLASAVLGMESMLVTVLCPRHRGL